MLLDKGKYIEHIRDDDQILTMRKVLDKVERVVKNHTIEATDFLDPYQRKLAYSFLNRFNEISYYDEGGYNDAERKAIIIYPSYRDRYSLEPYVCALRVDGSFKFSNVSHRDYLGALMSLGIKREKIGDIIVHEDFGQIILHREILDYVLFNFKTIAKESVELKEIDLVNIIKANREFKEIKATVASLRLDSIISSAFNISRSNSLGYIKGNKVKVNYQPIEQPSFEVKEGDLISLRGQGRVTLYDVNGKSRRDRFKITLRKII